MADINLLGANVWQSYLVTDALAQVGKWITVPEAAEILGIPMGKVRRLIEEHNLIAVRREGALRIPAEIIVNGEPLPSLRGTVLVLLDSGFNLEQAVQWLYTEEPLLGATPMNALLAGRKSEIRRLAQALAL